MYFNKIFLNFFSFKETATLERPDSYGNGSVNGSGYGGGGGGGGGYSKKSQNAANSQQYEDNVPQKPKTVVCYICGKFYKILSYFIY